MSDRQPIGVVGVGWVGLVTAACFAELGHRVVARDVVAEKVEALGAGRGLDPRAPPRRAGRSATTSASPSRTDIGELLDAARLLFVCVDTPPTESGDADLSRVRSVIADFLRAASTPW